MSVSTVQTPPTDLQLLLRATQQKREAARDSQGAPAGAATTAPGATAAGSTATGDAAKLLPELGKDAAKLVTDLKALLIGQQSDAGSTTASTATQTPVGTSATTGTAAATSDLSASIPASGGRRAGGHHHYHAPSSDSLPTSAPSVGTSTAGTSAASPTSATFLAQTLAKALQAYARGTQATANATTPFAAA